MLIYDRDARKDLERLIIGNHYTRSVPSGKSLYCVHEDAVVVFAIPANKNISRWLLADDNLVWELARLWAPDGHRRNLLTEALSVAVSDFRQAVPYAQALVSYADPNVGHQGYVYRAASWVPMGRCEETRAYRGINGEVVSRRSFHSGKKSLSKAEIEALGFVQLKLPGKLRFARGLTKKARKRIALRKKTIAT